MIPKRTHLLLNGRTRTATQTEESSPSFDDALWKVRESGCNLEESLDIEIGGSTDLGSRGEWVKEAWLRAVIKGDAGWTPTGIAGNTLRTPLGFPLITVFVKLVGGAQLASAGSEARRSFSGRKQYTSQQVVVRLVK